MRAIDRVGETFGRLTVLERIPCPSHVVKRESWWRCRCSCGGYLDVSNARIQSGNTRSCGCLQNESRRNWSDACNPHSAHGRVRGMWGSASQYNCIECGNRAQDWAYDGTDPCQKYEEYRGSWVYYSESPEFYMPMWCHMKRDKSSAAAELREYRNWKHRTGKTLSDIS